MPSGPPPEQACRLIRQNRAETAGQPDLAVSLAGQDDRAASDDGMAGGADTGLDVRPSCVAGGCRAA